MPDVSRAFQTDPIRLVSCFTCRRNPFPWTHRCRCSSMAMGCTRPAASCILGPRYHLHKCTPLPARKDKLGQLNQGWIIQKVYHISYLKSIIKKRSEQKNCASNSSGILFKMCQVSRKYQTNAII